MSANLDFNKEKEQYAFFGTKPAWHSKGQIVSEAKTSEEAIALSHLDYSVYKYPIYTEVNGIVQEVEDKFATVRTDTGKALGVVGSRYTVLQNSQAFKFVDGIVGAKEAIFESAGALDGGRTIFITCKLPQQLVVGDDVADNYFFITNNHTGAGSVQVAFSQVYIVCENTLREALTKSKRKNSVRHTSSVVTNLNNVTELMGITRKKIDNMQEKFTAMTKVKMDDFQLKEFIQNCLQREQLTNEEYSTRFNNTVDSVYEYALSDPAQMIVERKGTLWGAMQSVSGAINNRQKFKSAEDKLTSIISGTSNGYIQKAYELADQFLFNN